MDSVSVIETSIGLVSSVIEILNVPTCGHAISPSTHSSLKCARQLLNSTLFSAPPFQYTGKSGRAVCVERGAGKSFAPPAGGGGRGGQKVLPSGGSCSCVGEKFSVLRAGGEGAGAGAHARGPPQRPPPVPLGTAPLEGPCAGSTAILRMLRW